MTVDELIQALQELSAEGRGDAVVYTRRGFVDEVHVGPGGYEHEVWLS